MPRQRNRTYDFPEDFPQRLERFQEESGLSWSEIARRLETYRHTVWRWAEGRVRPNHQHRKALLELADSLGLVYLFTEWPVFYLSVFARTREVNVPKTIVKREDSST